MKHQHYIEPDTHEDISQPILGIEVEETDSSGANHSNKHMSARKRFLFLALIMVIVCAMVMAVITAILYRHEIKQQRELLQVTAKSHARLVEAVARYDEKISDALQDAYPGHDASKATLSQIIDAHDRFQGFGQTGEFTLARREGESIIFVLQHRGDTVKRPAPVAFDSDLAAPMRLALMGLSGTIIDLDYRGETVLAAYEPVAVLNMGIVAKIDLAEIHAPFIRSGLIAAAIALLIVLAGTALFFWISNPIIAHLEAYSLNLEKEVDARKMSEKALRESEEQFRRGVMDAPVPIMIHAEDGEVLRINNAWMELTGYTHSEIPTIADWTSRAYGQRMNDVLAGINSLFRRNGVVYEGEFSIRIKSGQTRIWDFSSAPLGQLPDERRLMISMAMDITDRKKAEERIKQQQYLLEKAQELGRIGTWELDIIGNKLYWTDENCRIFGVPPGSMVNYEIFIEKVHPDDREYVDLEWNAAMHGKHYDIEHRLVIDDATKWVREKADVEFDEGGSAVNAIGFTQDISELKQAEAEKLALERQVQHAQKLESLGVLAGGIAHDFNNLLMAILGNADLALDELSPMSPARENIQEIMQASKRAAELAKQMLAYSGKGQFVIEPINLGELVTEMAHLLEVSISKKAVLKYNFADNLPTFDGDVTQIRQIIMNLIVNASEAVGDNSGVIALSTGAMNCDRAYLDDVNEIIRASLDEPLPEGVYTYIEVADTGCGMDAETIEKVFDPFFTTKFTGRGLGMSAVLGIVRGHKGSLKIYSEIDKGTTIKILFPANELPDNDSVIQDKDISEKNNWRGSGTILLADDEETVCAVGKRMLERMGFSILTAPDGREALKLYLEHSDEIVCILLDLTMPHMDGEETYRELRRIRPDIKVILCSGYNEQNATQQFAGKGLAGFIQKPFNIISLREILMKVLGDERTEPNEAAN